MFSRIKVREKPQNNSCYELLSLIVTFSLPLGLVYRNKQGSTPLDILKRMQVDSSTTTLLQHLQEEEQRRVGGVATGRAWEKLPRSLRWIFRDVTRELGWRVMLLVAIILCFVAWQLTVYLHGQSPFYPKAYN